MTRKRHTEEQIIAVLTDTQAGVNLGYHLLYVADEIRGPGSQRREEAASAGREKLAVEAAGGRVSAGHPGVEGDHRKTGRAQDEEGLLHSTEASYDAPTSFVSTNHKARPSPEKHVSRPERSEYQVL